MAENSFDVVVIGGGPGGYVAAIRSSKGVLLLETMYHSEEILPAEKLDKPSKARVGEKELKTAEQLINSLSGHFEPEKLRDEYRDAVLELVEKKAEGEEVVTQPEAPPKATEVSDILAALEASLAEARKKKGHEAPKREKAGRH